MTACVERNLLRANNFKVSIPLAALVGDFVQDISLPGVSAGQPIQPTFLADIPHIGDKLQYDSVDLTFLVQENMENYKQLYNWFLRIADPNAMPLGPHGTNPSLRTKDRSKLYCDISIHVLNNNSNVASTIYLVDAFPITLSPLQFSTMNEDVLTANCVFAYSYLRFDSYLQDVQDAI